MRNLKVLGLALVAMLAMGALAASAQAAVHFTANSGGGLATLTGAKTSAHIFSTPGGETQCEIANFHGQSATGTETELTITPTYENCEAFELPATVTFNGCDYKFATPTKTSADNYTGRVDLHCPPHKVVEIHIFLFEDDWSGLVCTVTVKPTTETTTDGSRDNVYSFGGHVTYQDTTTTPGTPNSVHVNANVNSIRYEEHGSFCPDGNTVAGANATYTGNVKVTGDNEAGNPISVEVTGE